MTMVIDDDSSCCGIGAKIDVPEDTSGWIGDSPNIWDALANDDYYKSLTSEEERKAYSNDVYKKHIWVSDYPDPRFFTDSQFRLDNPNYKVKRVTLYEREQKWQKSGRIPIKVSSQSEARIGREIMRQDKLRKRLQEKEKEKEIVCGLKKLKLEEQQEKEKDQSQLEKLENQTSPQEYKTIQLLAVSVEADENFEG